MSRHTPITGSLRRLGEYAEQTGGDKTDPDFVIPSDLASLSDAELLELHEQAIALFDSLYGDGTGLSEEDVATLSTLTEGIESVQAVLTTRDEEMTERAARAAELAARAKPAAVVDPTEVPTEVAPVEVEQPEAIAASARKEIRIGFGHRARQLPKAEVGRTMKDLMHAAGEGTGFGSGEGIDWADAGKIVDRRLAAFNITQYKTAARRGQRLRQQFPVLTIRKPIADNMMLKSNDPLYVEDLLKRATDEHRLPQGSLVASGGWCAPSETVYNLLEMESRDGIYSLPEIGITRGGINRTLGPNFAEIYAAFPGFNYTEAQDIAGTYDVDSEGEGTGEAGSKPCYVVDCPDFEDFRLGVSGLCITAGLLQQRGYPEVIARTVRGALVAHDHRMAGRVIADVITGSTSVVMPMPQAGAIAPLLTAIELQTEHYRYTHRLTRATTLEAVFPYWVHGAIRSDLSRRNGVNYFDVTDAQIDGWFSLRGIAPQFIYNFQDINTTSAANFKQWPTTVSFLLYPAGAWVRGTSDIISLDTLYDSTLLGGNDYTALFTEEGWMVVKMTHDSRLVTVPLCPDGSAAALVDFMCDGTSQDPETVPYGPTTTTSTTAVPVTTTSTTAAPVTTTSTTAEVTTTTTTSAG